jgi:predicted PolB exonuclease-like 3'-5' exonuclease
MPPLPTDTSGLVIDIETVVDGRLIQRVEWPSETSLTPSAATARLQNELLEGSNGKSDFIPHVYHVPVSIALAAIDQKYSLVGLTTLDRPRFRPHIISKLFWDGWSARRCPQLITFNGRTFDLPVLEMAAFRYGIAVPNWFGVDGPSSPRSRYQQRGHLDLMEFLTSFGASRQTGGLHLLATLLQKPGKMETKGSMVQDLWDAGEHTRIDDYCVCDALDTYFVHLRLAVLRGKVRPEDEHGLVERAHAVIESSRSEYPGLTEYLDKFQYWTAPLDETSGFLP